MIRIQNLHHRFQREGKAPIHALRGIDLAIQPGEYVAILGHNGSGKSTLAKHLNGLLLPSEGDVWVKNWNTKSKEHLRPIRSTVGMVFQTPDNQIVATVVEEDIAFGPENLGVERSEILRRVDWSLDQVEMARFRHRAPHLLSGGQKQRVCIAGVLAMQPEVLVLDEATAMLDPIGRKEVLTIARRLNQERGVTVVAITHFMHEALQAERVVIMSEGQIALQGTPRQVFGQIEQLRQLHLDVPQVTELALRLHERRPEFPTDIFTTEEMIAALQQHWPELSTRSTQSTQSTQGTPSQPSTDADLADAKPLGESLGEPPGKPMGEPLIDVEHLVHYYMRNTPLEVKALHDINLAVHKDEIVGIIGHTGSGKSTVVQHFNGLLRAHEGKVRAMGQDLGNSQVDMRQIRQRVGLVFQFPESQLFEQYVGDDVAYGPRNLKLNREEVRRRVRKAMESVGLGFEEFKDRLTFTLSGGQMRRVALAGVLALEPEVLVLDEPTAGLDPQGRKQLLRHIVELHRQGVTLIMISHNMEELAAICNRIYVLSDGRTLLSGTPGEVFGNTPLLHELGLDSPEVTQLFVGLVKAGLLPPAHTVYTLEQAVARL
jgi:energy-coupling factor transport system ATP-binding protein